jgi:hypothetical protein
VVNVGPVGVGAVDDVAMNVTAVGVDATEVATREASAVDVITAHI